MHEHVLDVALRDDEKTAHAARSGYRLLRVSNDDAWERLDQVIEMVRSTISAPHPLPPPRKGEGEP